MKKAVVVAFILFFAVGMFHYFYAEDHCPVHCPSRNGGFGHVHQHHGSASSCLCFWTSLFGPETDDLARSMAFTTLDVLASHEDQRAPMGADIAHPPKPFFS